MLVLMSGAFLCSSLCSAIALDKNALFGKRPALRATVTVTDNLPPLPPQYSIGSVFSPEDKARPEAEGTNRWYEIPTWLAGEFSYDVPLWSKAFSPDGKSVDLDISKSKGLQHGRMRGILKDEKGRIWQKAYGGNIVDSANDPGDSSLKKYRFEDELVGLIVDPKTYVESSYGVEIIIDSKTKKIRGVLRYERARTFTVDDKDQVFIEKVERKFGANGAPLLTFKSKHHMTKRASFSPLEPGQTSSIAGTYDEAVTSLYDYLKLISPSD